MKMIRMVWDVLYPLIMDKFTRERQGKVVDNVLVEKRYYGMGLCERKMEGMGHIVICNHLHALDALMIRENLDGWVISKSNLADGNIFYKMFEWRVQSAYRSIPYERGNLRSGEIVKEKIMEKIDVGENVIIFPEGNCKYNHQDGLLPLKKGIIYLSYERRVPIVILTVWYNNLEFGQGGHHSFSLRRTLGMDVSGELYYEEVVYPVDFGSFEEYYDYISENMNWNAIIKN